MALELSREDWLKEASELLLDGAFAEAGIDRPPHGYRVSVGFPSHRGTRNGRVIAACWKKEASDDGVAEIFVSPTEADSGRVLEALAHELVHYVDNCESGHRNAFARMARGIGLAGPLTATHAGPKLAAELAEIADTLGPIPHAALNPAKSGRKKQTTRMLKLECSACDFICRTTLKHVQRIDYASPCPACGSETFGAYASGVAAREA